MSTRGPQCPLTCHWWTGNWVAYRATLFTPFPSATESLAAVSMNTVAGATQLSLQAESVAKGAAAGLVQGIADVLGDPEEAKKALGLNTEALISLREAILKTKELGEDPVEKQKRLEAEKQQQEAFSQENVLKMAETNFQGPVGSQASSVPGLTNDELKKIMDPNNIITSSEQLDFSNVANVTKRNIINLNPDELMEIGKKHSGNEEILKMIHRELKNDKPGRFGRAR